MKTPQKGIENRSYSRKELYILYYLDVTPRSASQSFTRDLEKDEELMAELKAAGYRDSQRSFKPRLVEIIVRHWGNPNGLLIEEPKSYRR